MAGIRVELDNIYKTYASKDLFSGINAVVEPGKLMAIFGCNGAGKSTLIKIIAGLIRPSTGAVSFTRESHRLSASDRLSCLGIVSPELTMYNALTGYENITFLLKARGIEPNHDKIEIFLERVGLSASKNDFVKNYSTGMRQRLKLAALLTIRPEVWLLDEPSSNLDDDGRALVKDLIATALENDVTVVLATNDYQEASYADTTIKLA